MHKGSCLCGAVMFEVKGDLRPPDDQPTHTRLAIHVHVTDKGDYYDIADGLPQNQH